MQPVFQDYIDMLHSHKVDIPGLREGFFWIDRLIIRAFDKAGKEVKVARLKISNDLAISAKMYKDALDTKEYESWSETVRRNESRLSKIEENALGLISKSLDAYQGHHPVVLHSSGKDSTITHYLVSQVVDRVPVLFNNTSLDCADSYRFIKAVPNVSIMSPKIGFHSGARWMASYLLGSLEAAVGYTKKKL